jgi:uncharacterized RDD family membrane protein YckC
MIYPSVIRRYLASLLDLLVVWSGVYLLIQIQGLAKSNLRIGIILGGISILTIPSRADRRAIHDFATDTIVIESSIAEP